MEASEISAQYERMKQCRQQYVQLKKEVLALDGRMKTIASSDVPQNKSCQNSQKENCQYDAYYAPITGVLEQRSTIKKMIYAYGLDTTNHDAKSITDSENKLNILRNNFARHSHFETKGSRW